MTLRRSDIGERTRDQIIGLHHAGNSVADICRVVSRSAEMVSAVLRDAGIARPSHQTRANRTGDDLGDPRRADRLLRQF